MAEFHEEVARTAENAVAMCSYWAGDELDYSEASLAVVEKILEASPEWLDELTPEQVANLIQDFGCYILEVGRREFGGRYFWHDGREQPVLVVGEPAFRVAILAGDKVRGRLSGDEGDNIPFFYAGFAERARRASPGSDVLYV